MTDSATKHSRSEPAPSAILVIDIGGTKIKVLASGQTEARKIPSGRRMTPSRMVKEVRELASDWKYEAVRIGYPGLVGANGPRSEAGNLGPGWVGFDFAAAFGCPVRIANDAAMQALGSYEGGRMLFLGLGTGLGSALAAENVILSLELGQLRGVDGQTLSEVLGRNGREKLGKKAWRQAVVEVVTTLMHAFVADYVMIGGGNAKQLKELPPGCRQGHNLTAFRGGFRLWHLDDMQTLSPHGETTVPPTPTATDWRLI